MYILQCKLLLLSWCQYSDYYDYIEYLILPYLANFVLYEGSS